MKKTVVPFIEYSAGTAWLLVSAVLFYWAGVKIGEVSPTIFALVFPLLIAGALMMVVFGKTIAERVAGEPADRASVEMREHIAAKSAFHICAQILRTDVVVVSGDRESTSMSIPSVLSMSSRKGGLVVDARTSVVVSELSASLLKRIQVQNSARPRLVPEFATIISADHTNRVNHDSLFYAHVTNSEGRYAIH